MAEKPFYFRIELNSSSNNTVIRTEIPFEAIPKTFEEVANEVEAIYSIPACVQSLSLCYSDYCHKIKDSDTPTSLYIRSGDLIRIHYPLQGECREVRYAKNILFITVETVTKLLNMAQHREDCCLGVKFVTKYMMSNTIRADKLAISLSPFYPWTDIAHVNKLFFISLGGISLLIKLYTLVLEFRKKRLHLKEGDMFEVVCVHTLSSFTGSMDFGYCVANQRCLELLLDTFLWIPVSSEHATDIHIAAIQVALHAICNIIVPDHYAEQERSYEIIMQTIAICMTPVYKCKTAIVSLMLLTCVTYCCELSAALVPNIFTDLISILNFRREIHPNETAAVAMLDAYGGTLLSLQILNDVTAFKNYETMLKQICEVLERTVHNDAAVVQNYESNEEFFWGSTLPALTSLYRPDDGQEGYSLVFKKVIRLCTLTLLHTLQIILGHQSKLIVLLNEDLYDYVMSLPWIVPSQCSGKAKEVVKEVGKLIQMEPLPLLSLAKAKLAKTEYGLHRVLKAVSISDLLYPEINS